MTLQPCAPEPFVGTQQFEVPYGTTITKLNRVNKGLGFQWQMTVCRRPGIPIYGVGLNASNQFTVRYQAGVSSAGICSNAATVAYTAGFVIGNVVFDDAAMAVPHVGDDFIVDTTTGDIWSINNATGALIAVTSPGACSVIPAAQTYSFLPSTKGNEGALLNVALSAYMASYNFATDPVNPNEIYTGDFGTYLYRKLASDSCLLNRYLEVYNKMVTFFNLHAAIPAYTIAIYNELTAQVEKVMREADKQMAIPPGVYDFLPGSAAQASLEIWFAADPTLSALFSIELVTT